MSKRSLGEALVSITHDTECVLSSAAFLAVPFSPTSPNAALTLEQKVSGDHGVNK